MQSNWLSFYTEETEMPAQEQVSWCPSSSVCHFIKDSKRSNDVSIVKTKKNCMTQPYILGYHCLIKSSFYFAYN